MKKNDGGCNSQDSQELSKTDAINDAENGEKPPKCVSRKRAAKRIIKAYAKSGAYCNEKNLTDAIDALYAHCMVKGIIPTQEGFSEVCKDQRLGNFVTNMDKDPFTKFHLVKGKRSRERRKIMNNTLTAKRGMTALLAIIVGFTLSFGAFMATPQTAYAATKTPTKVATVSISKKATTSFKVSYSKSSKAKKYQIAYKKASASKWSYKTTKSRSITLKSLSNNTKYQVKVRGVNGKKHGKWSKTKTATTTAKTPAKVGSLKKASVSTTSIKIKWNKSSNATKYQIAYKKASASKWSHKTVSSTSATLSGLSNNTKYQVKVRGVNARATTKYGSYSSTLTATTHTHNWVAQTKTIHHDAVYKTVHHVAVYDTILEEYYHCKECGADFDDFSSLDAHCKESVLQGGNPSYTLLPRYTQQLVTAAYDEQVLVSAAYDETVTTGYKCSTCGATK